MTQWPRAAEEAPHHSMPPARRSSTSRIIRAIFHATLIFTVFRVFVTDAAVVPTGSMQGTILIGDHILVDKLLYGPELPLTGLRLPQFKTPQRGQIIAFRYPRDPSMNFLKRVAAVGGDVVEIRDDVLYVNQMPVREPYVVHTGKQWLRRPEYMPAQHVSPGELFVLGDNRDNSDDSRYWGTVPEQNVIGTPIMVLWSYDAPTRDWLEDDPARELRFMASMFANLLGRTRWSRTGTLL